MAKNRVIGLENKLPWQISEDFDWFQTKTNGHPCIMGRKTLESLGLKKDGMQRVLSNRTNIIITSNSKYKVEGAIIVSSLLEAINKANESIGSDEVFICGGGQIYKEALDQNLIDKIYLTLIEEDVEGDTYFPELPADFKLTEEKKRIVKVNNKEIKYSFQIYNR